MSQNGHKLSELCHLKIPYDPQQLNDDSSTLSSKDACCKFSKKQSHSEKLNCNKAYQVDSCRKRKIEKNDAPNFRSSVNKMDGIKSCKAAFPRTGGCAAAVAKQ